MNKNLLIGGGAALGVIVLAIGGVLGAASVQPDTIHVERTVLMQATPADVHGLVNDFAHFESWSPWSEKDPNMVIETSATTAGVGAWHTWKGNDDVGAGKMTITASSPSRVEQLLEFKAPMESKADVVFSMVADGESTKVTWAMDMPADLSTKTMSLFMDMDAIIGADFHKGLQNMSVQATAVKTARVEAERIEADRLLAEEAAAAEAAALEIAQAEGGDEALPPGMNGGVAQ